MCVCYTEYVSELPLASILRRSLGLPAATCRGSLASFKGSSLIRNSSCAEVFCIAYDALRPFLQLRSGLIHTRSNLCQLDNWYMLDLTCISWITPTRWICLASTGQLILARQLIHVLSILHYPDNWYMRYNWYMLDLTCISRTTSSQSLLHWESSLQLDNWYIPDLTCISLTIDVCGNMADLTCISQRTDTCRTAGTCWI